MTVFAGEKILADHMNRAQPVLHSAVSSSPLALTNAEQDVPGATVTFTTLTANCKWDADASIDFDVTTASAGQTAIGRLYVDGVLFSPSREALHDMQTIGRGTVKQQWEGVFATPGSHTLKLVGIKTSAGGVATIPANHTSLHVTKSEVVGS